VNKPQRTSPKAHRWFRGLPAAVLLPLSLLVLSGCSWDELDPFPPPPPPPGPADTLVLRGDHLEAERLPADGPWVAQMAGAHELYRRGDYAMAEKHFHRIAENKKSPPPVAEEARYYEAECLRRQGCYPKAADTYVKMLNDFPSGPYREQAVQHMYEIANYWLDDTRGEMEEYKEKREGKRWVVWPTLFHWEKTKPLMDEEGRALEKLEQVRHNDITGPLADKSLFLAGSVRFFREDYREADYYFSQLVEMHPNSPFAPQAIELAIISKHMSTGGSDYDGRKVAEARQLVDVALRSYPELASQKEDFLKRQMAGITMQQAEKDYKVAEFYRRTGHPQSAYFYYEIVRRRYPGTKFFDMATERMHELRAVAEKEAAAAAPVVVTAPPVQVPTAPRVETTPMPQPVGPAQPPAQPTETTPQPRMLPPSLSGR
jgi:outer membrane protein assembly factor BamD (BamD/ComL family)